jgi:hypothetical protein
VIEEIVEHGVFRAQDVGDFHGARIRQKRKAGKRESGNGSCSRKAATGEDGGSRMEDGKIPFCSPTKNLRKGFDANCAN